jgi:2-methylisocitrate lyase-like PEP mutase family enzyme
MRVGITSDTRRGLLSALLAKKKCLRVIETHSPLSALLAEQSRFETSPGGYIEYDGFWSSSLTDSTLLGKPDIALLDIPGRLSKINDIFEVTTKPLIMDGDTGGKPEHFAYHVRSMERLGVSAVIIEDKTGLKKNSLLGNEVEQHQESIPEFCHKIKVGKAAQFADNFMIIARIESLILEAGLDDAMLRASAYVGVGADGIMIHSRQKQPTEVLDSARSTLVFLWSVCLPAIPLLTFTNWRRRDSISLSTPTTFCERHVWRCEPSPRTSCALGGLPRRTRSAFRSMRFWS